MVASTLAYAREADLAVINATIRAEKAGGLAVNEKVGFETYNVVPAVTLGDGTPVDRISKKLVL